MMRYFDATAASHPRHALTFDETAAALRLARLEQLRTFHRTYYGADHAEFAFVGDFDKNALNAQLNNLFGDWKAGKGCILIPEPCHAVAATTLGLDLPGKPSAIVLMQSQFPLDESDEDYPAMVVINQILGGDPLTSRIGGRLRQKEGITYGAGTQFSAGILDRTAFLTIYTITARQNIDAVEAAIGGDLARLLNEGVSDREVQEPVADLLKLREAERNDDAALADKLGNQAYYGFTFQQTIQLEQALSDLTGAQVTAALRRHLKPDTISVFGAGSFAGQEPGGAGQ